VSADINLKTVVQAYEAFGHGDVAGILSTLTDDVDWAAEASSSGAPWYGIRHGKDAVAQFFTEFGSAMEVEEFTPVTFAANDTDRLLPRQRGHGTGRGSPPAVARRATVAGVALVAPAAASAANSSAFGLGVVYSEGLAAGAVQVVSGCTRQNGCPAGSA
jgi:ketosteroid isomerase-like protein